MVMLLVLELDVPVEAACWLQLELPNGCFRCGR